MTQSKKTDRDFFEEPLLSLKGLEPYQVPQSTHFHQLGTRGDTGRVRRKRLWLLELVTGGRLHVTKDM